MNMGRTHAASGTLADGAGGPLLDAVDLPILFLDRERRFLGGNRAATRDFGAGAGPGASGALESVRASDPVAGLRPGQATVVDLTMEGRPCRMTCRRLETPVDNAAYVLVVCPGGRDGGADEQAVRRMKHRFNNFMAPMAGKAEIILFALRKGNYGKVEKAANDILRHVEDKEALDALFDPEPVQESNAITYYVS